MDISRLRNFFGLGGAPAPGAQPARDEGLDYHCNYLKQLLDRAGYEIAHSSDYVYYRMHEPEVYKRRLGEGMIRHFNNVARASAKGDTHTETLLNDLSHGLNGYAFSPDKIICLPDEDGLLDRVAAEYQLYPDSLRRIGLTDQYLYAYLLIHEATHVSGNKPLGQEPAFTSGEFQTHVTGLARFLEACDFKPDHPVPRFITAYLSNATLGSALKSGTDQYDYSWVDRAFELLNASWDNREKYWDSRNGVFLPGAYEKFSAFGKHDERATTPRPFSLALKTLSEHSTAYLNPVAEAAASLAQKAEETGSHVSRDAARILTRYQAALRVLGPHAMPASRIFQDCNKYLGRDELFFAPRR